MATKGNNLVLLILSCYFFFVSRAAHFDRHTILQGQQLGNSEHLVSADGSFRLGFFNPGTSRNRYLGIWYNIITDGSAGWHKDKKAVWVANRNTPISDTSGSLMIDELGILKISYSGGNPIVLSSVQGASNASATLLDSGNFILRELNSDGSTNRVLWQSFDYPTDTLLPGMKLGRNFKTGHTWSLTSWISDNVPAPGSFTLGGDPNGTSQWIIWWQEKVYWTSGLWYDGRFELLPALAYQENNFILVFSYFSNENEKYWTFSVNRNYTMSRYTINSEGRVSKEFRQPIFGACPPFSHPGFTDVGCVNEELPECRNTDDWFEERRGYRSDNGIKSDESYNTSLFDCHAKCLNICSCVAYASTNDDDQSGCEIWNQGMSFRDSGKGARIYHVLHTDKAKWWIWLIIAVAGVLVILVLCSLFYLIRRKLRTEELCSLFYLIRRKLRTEGKNKREEEMLLCELGAINITAHSRKSGKTKKLKRDGKKSQELRFFSFESIASATDNFATTNKLGEGGYGPVYKGELHDGQEIAIKRLSRNSGQGVVEFKNEVILIAKQHHINLVRLVGCCIQREEKILIYEYMPNKSLDFFLFDPQRKNLLDWKKRFNIIEGVAQGLLYLHKYSRSRIIHRDLKAGNILLDGEMNPKISDFGMARMFEQNESKAKTNRVVGTYGYMSPEYAMEGIFSMKSDVFSFGVLLLEIVSGRKNNSYYHDEHPLSLAGHAWELWREDRVLELTDSTLVDPYHNNEVLKCIHVGLLCVQDSPADRPTMSNVVSMISNETIPLSAPKQPAFFIGRSLLGEAEIAKPNSANISLNNVTISDMEARS